MKFIKKYKVYESLDLSLEPPKGLEEQIAFSMKWYPTLYDSKYGRIKVLDHMYLGYGTEYEWEDGELVNFSDLNTDHDMYNYRESRWSRERLNNIKKLKELEDHWNDMYNISVRTGQTDDIYLPRIKWEIEELEDKIDNFDPYGKEYTGEKPLAFKNISYSKQYSPIFHIPDDIKEDYLKGAKEIVKYILDFKKTDTETHKDMLEVAKKIGLKI